MKNGLTVLCTTLCGREKKDTEVNTKNFFFANYKSQNVFERSQIVTLQVIVLVIQQLCVFLCVQYNSILGV